MTTSRSDLDILADKLRKCYQFERNQLLRSHNRPDNYEVPEHWRGGGREKKGKSTFHQLALFCQKQEIDPIHYIQWCLHPAQVLLEKPPEPNQLLTLLKMNTYRESQPKRRKAQLEAFNREMNYARDEYGFKVRSVTAKRAWTIVLLNGSLEVSPLFRYACALTLALGDKKEHYLNIAENWEARAMFQYQYDPEVYDRSWVKVVLPPDFAERAAHFYAQLIDKEP